jgi:hypothetical protein
LRPKDAEAADRSSYRLTSTAPTPAFPPARRNDILTRGAMMKPSIWTTMFYPSTPAQALEVLASHGWQAFELSCEHIGALQQLGPQALGY